MTPLLITVALLALAASSRATDPCAANKTCIPTAADYDMNVGEVLAPLGASHWVKCRGRYALCAFANCSAIPDTDPPLAECGCYAPKRRSWFVTPRQLKSAALYNLTAGVCFEGDAMANNNTGCTDINSAPACTGIKERWIYSRNYDLISTFAPTKDIGQTNCTGPGLMAECMSAACYRKQAFDGSPVTCYCLLVSVPEGQAYSLGSRRTDEPVSCEQPAGYAISGEYTAQGS